MKRFGIGLAIIIIALTIYRAFFPSATVRYRLMLEVQVDGQAKTNSNTIAVTYSKNLRFLGSSADVSVDVDGEALQLDLGSRGLLLVLLAAGKDRGSDPEFLGPIVFGLSKGGLGFGNIAHVAELRGHRNLPVELLPLMVILRSPNDPTTLQRIDAKQFPATLVDGVTLNQPTLEIIDDGIWPLSFFGLTGAAPTSGIEARLPWLNDPAAQSSFWQSLLASGYRPNGSIEIMQIFKRGH